MQIQESDRVIFHPKDEAEWLALRASDVTSTASPALFGLSPYSTYYEVFHSLKSGIALPFEANEFVRWGQRLQDAIAAGVAEDNGWKIRPMKEYIRIPSLGMGSSFDFEIFSPPKIVAPGTDTHSPMFEDQPKGLLEIKNVFGIRFNDEWLKDEEGNFEAPPHIEMQVQHQLAVSGYSFAYIAALVSGNQLVLIRRDRDERIIDAIFHHVKAIRDQIASGKDPEPNFQLDAGMISRLYGYAEPGKLFDATQNERVAELVVEDQKLKKLADEAKAGREAIKAELLTILGDAEKAIGPGFSISAGTVGPTLVPAHERKGHRRCVIYVKKEKVAS